MEVLYKRVSVLYRFFVLITIAFLHFTIAKPFQHIKDIQSETVIMYLVFFVFGIVFSLFDKNKIGTIAELIAAGIMFHFYDDVSFMYLIFVVPIIQLSSFKLKYWEMSSIAIVTSLYVFVETTNWVYTITIGLGLFITFLLLKMKLGEIEYLYEQLLKERKNSDQKSGEILEKDKEIDLITKMFVEISSLNEISEEEEKIIQQLVESCRFFFNAEYTCLYVREPNDGFYKKVAFTGKTERFQVPEILEYSQENLHPIIKGERLQVSIQYEGEDWGVISIYGKRTDIGMQGQLMSVPFQDNDYELLLVYTVQAMFKLKHIRLMKKNERLANYDFLTDVPNRRHFWEMFERYIDFAKRNGTMAFVILDVDHFKKFNDKYGHDVGDAVLKIVAETIQGAIRKTDFIGRLGGEEFGVLLMNPKEFTYEISEKIRKRVSVIPGQERITISLGVAEFGTGGVTSEEMFKNADRALYYSKENGRNQTTIYSPLMEDIN